VISCHSNILLADNRPDCRVSTEQSRAKEVSHQVVGIEKDIKPESSWPIFFEIRTTAHILAPFLEIFFTAVLRQATPRYASPRYATLHDGLFSFCATGYFMSKKDSVTLG